MRVNRYAFLAIVLISPVGLLGCFQSGGKITIEQANRMNAFELLTAAGKARANEDAAFLFFAAQMRFQIDMQVFPPVQTGADSPNVLKSALSFTIGSRVGPLI